MNLQEGDWVRTETGEIGKVIHIHRLSAFVELKGPQSEHGIQSLLLSTLTKIDAPPQNENEPAT